MPISIADAVFWAAVVLCTIAEFFIIRSAIIKRPAIARAPEVVWAVIPALALALVFAATWRAMHPSIAGVDRPVSGPVAQR